METIELKPKPFQIALRLFLLMFTLFFMAKHCAYGLSIIHDPEFLLILRARAIEALVAIATFFLVMAIPLIRGRFNIRLTKTTLQAPMKTRRFELLKSSTVNLSNISVNRSLRDRLIGTQLVTSDGQPMHIFPFFYAHKSISKLLDEIEWRQDEIKKSQPEHSPYRFAQGDA